MTYNVYLPAVMRDEVNSKRGLALCQYYPEDLEGVSWYYDWGAGGSGRGYVPMSYSGEDPHLPLDYSDWLMVFNEPNNGAPYGANISAIDGAARFLALKTLYTQAHFVVGNVTVRGLSWLQDFRVNCGEVRPDAWGMHGYIEGNNSLEDVKRLIHQAYTVLGGEFWISEWADASGNVDNNDILSTWLNNQNWITRWAYFTNRALGTEPWWPAGWNTQLRDMDGNNTPVGDWWDRMGTKD
jgi:hypothetical protein